MTTFKRGTRITYTYAGGKVVSGKIVGPYDKAMPNWWRVELTDEAGTYRGGAHADQITVTDNRRAA
jgi:hypothetical protein